MIAPHRPDPVRGALAGLIGGLVASAAMDGFQRMVAAVTKPPEGEPATEKAADRVALLTTGAELPKEQKGIGGQFVHYATGAGLGLAYGVTAEFLPDVTRGGGTAYATGVAGLLDEAAVPALGLGPAPWHTDAATHAYGAASHILFGLAMEATRALVRRL